MRAIIFALFLSLPVVAASFEGYWEGVLHSKGEECPVRIEITKNGDQYAGTYSMPRYKWLDVPFKDFTVARGSFHAMYDSVPPLVLDGKIEGLGKKAVLMGQWKCGKYGSTFALRPASPPELPYTIEEVVFANGDVTLAGAVYAPKSSGRHAAAVVLHGSGDNPRWHFHQAGDWFARQGMVCLIFDKRGNGKSTGKWLDVGFNELADDGIAGLRMLQLRADVDPKRIGFWGISQAGWIMEAAAQRCADTAFFISISGGTALVEREGYWDYECILRNHGYSEADVAEVLEMMKRYNAVIRTGEGYPEFLDWMQPLRQKPYWSLLEWAPRPPTAIHQRWYKRVMDFDPEPILRTLNIPMLFIFGEADDSNPTAEGVAMLHRVKVETGRDITVHVFPGADHGVRVAAAPDAAFPFRIRPEAFWEDTAQWLKEKGVNP